MVYRESFKVESRHRAVSFHDVTEQVKEIVKKSGVKEGIVVVYSHHTTCSVITQECAFDMSMTGLETLQQDLVNCFEEWIPPAAPKVCTSIPVTKLSYLQKSTVRITSAATTPMRISVLPSSAAT